MDKVLERVTDTMDCRKLHQEVKYNIPKKCQGHIQTIMKELKKEKVIEFGTGLTMFEEITLKMEGHEFLQIAKLLHEQVNKEVYDQLNPFCATKSINFNQIYVKMKCPFSTKNIFYEIKCIHNKQI